MNSSSRRLMLKDNKTMQIIKNWWDTIHQDWKPVIDSYGLPPEHEKTAYFILMGFVTQDTRLIKRVMPECKKEWLQSRRKLAIKHGLWTGQGTLKAKWLDEDTVANGLADIAFLLDILTVNGDMLVTKNSRGEDVYFFKNPEELGHLSLLTNNNFTL